MNPETQRLKKELKRDVQDTMAGLRGLRDELRLQIHLGGMDARRKWDELEQDFAKVQSATKRATDASVVALRDAYMDLKASLRGPDRK